MPPEQKILPLTAEDEARLNKQRAVVESMFRDNPDLMAKYQTVQGKLMILSSILKQKIFKPTDTYQLQCMGVILGDAFVQQCGLRWRMVEDQYGRNPMVQYPGTTAVFGALTMISKRVERGENFEVSSIFNTIASLVEDIGKKSIKGGRLNLKTSLSLSPNLQPFQ